MEHPISIEARLVYSSPWLQVREDTIHYSDKTKLYPVVERSNSVIVVPLTPKQTTILLRQYRHPVKEFSWEFPMGGVDDGEAPEEAARREFQEELDLSPSHLELVGKYLAVPGLTSQEVSIFVAHITEKQIVEASVENQTDDIESFKALHFNEVIQMIKGGQIQDGFTLVGSLFVKLYRETNLLNK